MNSQRTPGEWNIEENVSHYPFVMGDDNNLIAMLIDGRMGGLFYGRTIEETFANALLISQAPAMYEALKVLAELDLTGVTGDIVYQRDNSYIKVSDVLNAREILKKATNNQ